MPRCGGRKLYHLLQTFFEEKGIKMGRDKFFVFLEEHNLLIKRKKRKNTTNSYHRFRKYSNLVKDKQLTKANQLWVSDITYINLGSSFIYLSLVTDAYSRKIVGWNLSPTLAAQGTINALKMAIKQLNEESIELVHHSDRGIQYCCKAYIKLLKDNGITISMTEHGDPYENIIAERMNKTIKEEFVDCFFFFDLKQVKKILQQAIN